MVHSMIGAFSGYKPGHEINNLLVREMLQQPESWELVVSDDASKRKSPIAYEQTQAQAVQMAI